MKVKWEVQKIVLSVRNDGAPLMADGVHCKQMGLPNHSAVLQMQDMMDTTGASV